MTRNNVTRFSQRDPRWANDILGTGNLTLGQAGCLVSSVASLLCDMGIDTDPKRLNVWLRENRGFYDGNLFIFSSVERLGVKLRRLIRCMYTPAPVDEIAEALRSGDGCVAMVDFRAGGPVEQHWVRVLELAADDGLIMDPWQPPGKEIIRLKRYLANGWNTARGIFSAAIYGKREETRGVSVDEPMTQTAIACQPHVAILEDWQNA